MSYQQQYNEWYDEYSQYIEIYNKHREYSMWYNQYTQYLSQVKNIQQNVLLALLVHRLASKKKRYTRKKYWVSPLCEERRDHGFYHALFPVIALEESRFRNYFRMTPVEFEALLAVVGPSIAKQSAVREAITPAERLCVTLRFLASGDSMTSITYQYCMGLTTVAHIIEETCEAIWSLLCPEVLPHQYSNDHWLKKAKEFEEKWNFPHCCGAIDGKHLIMQCPDNAGSTYYNYKNSHSITLMAICDANYIFEFVDIGAPGRRSDGGIFKESKMGQKFYWNQMNLPKATQLTIDGPLLPYVIVGDEAFQLTDFMMRPYPAKGGLNQDRNVFNYRLSRARRTIENTFGIMVSQWRIFRRPIICSIEKTKNIAKAAVCLHNWLRIKDLDENKYVPEDLVDHDTPSGTVLGNWRNVIDGSALKDISNCGSNSASRKAMTIRDEFCKYFNSAEGLVPWQYNHC